ncbi:SH3 domain-containing kinase-binding protein 1 isoform X8 [Eleginops maclovinus]|uniref:SH3 domain-containing kinase-binding protein 1 isoform X8 n=1 Tax=Eleginops maclovinus TaxID=56733 RepID=UPI003080EA2C
MVDAVVEFDYEAQQDDELSLTVGDIIANIRRDDGGWWEGELGGRRGLFPDNFVREIKKDGKRDGGQASMIRSELSNGRTSPVSDPSVRPGRRVEQIRKRRCKASFSYVPQHEDELELKIGDIIEIIAEVEEGWWEGFLNGKTGMFPSNFTKVVQTDSETHSVDTSQEELRSSRTSKDSPGSESDGGDSRSETGSGEIQPKKVRGFGFGDIFKDQPIRLRPRSMEVDSEVDKANDDKAASVASETMKTEPDGKAKGLELCKVLFPYEAQNEDELSLKEGEIINIITKRPKKPPPPSAPSAKQTTDVDLDVVVASTEKLSHPTASRPRVTDRRPRSQILSASSMSIMDLEPPAVEERKERMKEELDSVPSRPVEVTLRKGVPAVPGSDSKAPQPTRPSVLTPPSASHRPTSPSSSLGLSPSPELRHSPLSPPTLEELRNQLRDLRASVELLKSQHRQEMKQLTNALDEEKKIRVSLQMEVDHIKKSLSK